jgi:hypothetical protein
MRFKYLLICAVIFGAIVLFNDDSPKEANAPIASSVDLNRVLDITLSEIEDFERAFGVMFESSDSSDSSDQALFMFAESLQVSYNEAIPALHSLPVAVAPLVDASLMVAEDLNRDGVVQDDEGNVWIVEIDGENSRIIATSWQGEVRESGFSGSGFLAGYLISSMLGRQSIHGDPKAVARTQTRAPQQNVRARAGSGSHRSGK